MTLDVDDVDVDAGGTSATREGGGGVAVGGAIVCG